MRRLLLLAGLLLVAATSRADEPPDIVEIKQKIARGIRPSAEEQQRLAAWMMQASGAPEGSRTPGMPDDVAAIMQRLQAGQRPSPADLARLKQWGAEQKQRAGALKSDAASKAAELDALRPPPRGGVVSPFLEGTLVVRQTIETSSPCDDPARGSARATQAQSGTFRVRARTVEVGKPISFTAELGERGPFQLMLMDVGGGAEVRTDAQGYDCNDSTSGATSAHAALPQTSFAIGYAARPLVNMTLLTPSADLAAPGNPWGPAAMMPPELQAAAAAATFTLDGEKLRKIIRGRSKDHVVATYTSNTTTGGASIRTVTTFDLAFGPSESAIQLVVTDDQGAPSEKAWRDWLPVPWLEKAAEAQLFTFEGSRLAAKDPRVLLHVQVKAKTAGAPLRAEIVEASSHLGVCGNFPVDGGAEKDLLIVAPKGSRWKVSDDGQSATLDGAGLIENLDVAARDTAAEGKLRVTSGDQVGRFNPAGADFIPLPADDDHDHMADAWERDWNAKHAPTTVDDDPLPAGLGQDRGDGFSMFEEYRGFVAREIAQKDDDAAWRRLDPQAAELFVSDQTKDDRGKRAFADGMQLFVEATGLRTRVVPKAYLKTIARHTFPSWMDFNTPDEFGSDHTTHPMGKMPVQVAIPIADSGVIARPDTQRTDEKGQPVAHTSRCVYAHTWEAEGTATGDEMSRAPIDVDVVAIYPDNGGICLADAAVHPFGATGKKALAARGLTESKFKVEVTLRAAQLRYRSMVQALLHEFGHCFGLHHHSFPYLPADDWGTRGGDLACPVRYTDLDERFVLAQLFGDWNPGKSAYAPASEAHPDAFVLYEPGELGANKPHAPPSQAWLDGFLADMVRVPIGKPVPYHFCRRCASRVRLWATPATPFPLPGP